MSVLEDKVWQSLKMVFDPEIPVNVVDLGLIYQVTEYPINNIEIEMTITTPHCPAAAFLPEQVKEVTRETEGVNDVHVELVFQPAWSTNKISEEGRKVLGYK